METCNEEGEVEGINLGDVGKYHHETSNTTAYATTSTAAATTTTSTASTTGNATTVTGHIRFCDSDQRVTKSN